MIKTRLGRRGVFLLCLSVIDLGYSWAVYITLTPQQSGVSGLLFGWQVWAALWLAAGIVCLLGAFHTRDRFSFAIAAAIKFAWGGVSVYRWMIGRDPTGWISALLWILLSIIVLIVSSWPEVEDTE